MSSKNSRRPASIYSRFYSASEKRALLSVPIEEELSEVNLLRVIAARVLAAEEGSLQLQDRIKLLHAFNILAEQMNRLARARYLSHDPTDEIRKTILEALASLDPYDLLP